MNYFEELSKEDQAKSYAKFLKRKTADPSGETLRFLARRKMMPESQVMIQYNNNMNDILKPGYLDVEYGYCTLPNGGGYVSMLNKMPGVTFDMYLFWKKWWSDADDSDLRYKIWYPDSHFKAGYRWSCEDFGSGPEDLIFIQMVTPEQLGLDASLINEKTLLMADGCNVVSKSRASDPLSAPVPGVVCHFVRPLPDGDGIELRSRFWKGYQIGPSGFYDAMGPDTPHETEETLYALACHNAYEMANLASFLPELYAEEKDTVDLSDNALTEPGAGRVK